MNDPTTILSGAGVSIWLDDISRERLQSGNLHDLIDGKHVVGVTKLRCQSLTRGEASSG